MQDLIEGIECGFFTNVSEILKWAKVHGVNIERLHIIDAFVAGDERGTKEIPFNAEQYYSQTYTG